MVLDRCFWVGVIGDWFDEGVRNLVRFLLGLFRWFLVLMVYWVISISAGSVYFRMI